MENAVVCGGEAAALLNRWSRQLWRALVLSALTFAVGGCAGISRDLAGILPLTRPHWNATRHDIRSRLARTGNIDSVLAAFYAARGYRPVWSGSAAARRRAVVAMRVLAQADTQGLPLTAYPFAVSIVRRPGQRAAADDLELTQSLLAYMHDVRLGRLQPSQVYQDIRLPSRQFDPAAALARALATKDLKNFLKGLPPPAPQYRELVDALARYRRIEAKGGWQRLGPHPSRAQLAARLGFEDAAFAVLHHPSAGAVASALRRFQARHGLKPDGVFGPRTRQALNVTARQRIGEIKANLERWRWLPRHFPERYIVANVPAQRVALIVDGRTELQSKVVIGLKLADDTTPILLTKADAVIANPPWDIPDDIAIQGLLPHLRRDPNYLRARHMVLVGAPPHTRIDWANFTGSRLPYQIRQLPGPHNVLGNIMLNMPNHFDVYLHGTSDPRLFGLSDRARSHGCVRVQKIGKLAELALEGSVTDPAQALRAAIATGQTQRLALLRPLAVYLLYWTAQVEHDGEVAFWPDRYDRDPPLLAKLEPPATAVALHLLPGAKGARMGGGTRRRR
ncbi:MAG: L,D-transpeptidase family protein [Alphaproteobacteria bacterium]|nr:L,D-transpeptidase family protein [Alphaproteobacteria bacterium]